jgi:hypothetical protein
MLSHQFEEGSTCFAARASGFRNIAAASAKCIFQIFALKQTY